MDENRAQRVVDALRERGVPAHVERPGVGQFGMRVMLRDGREAIWDTDGTAGLEAQVMRNGVLVGFVPMIEGSEDFDEAQVVDAIARTDYDQPIAVVRATRPAGGAVPAPRGRLLPPVPQRLPRELALSRPRRDHEVNVMVARSGPTNFMIVFRATAASAVVETVAPAASPSVRPTLRTPPSGAVSPNLLPGGPVRAAKSRKARHHHVRSGVFAHDPVDFPAPAAGKIPTIMKLGGSRRAPTRFPRSWARGREWISKSRPRALDRRPKAWTRGTKRANGTRGRTLRRSWSYARDLEIDSRA